MSTVKLLRLWLNRHLSRSCFNRGVLGNTRINDYEATSCLLRPRRDFGSVSEKEADVNVGRKKNLRAVDIADKLRSEKEKSEAVTNKVGLLNCTIIILTVHYFRSDRINAWLTPFPSV